jgi:hypothetical protein
VAFLFGALFLTQGAPIQIAGFGFTAVRVLAIAAFLRVWFRREFSALRFNKIDWAAIVLYSYVTLIPILRVDSIPLRLAIWTDAMMCYFAFRSLVTDFEDVRFLVRILPLLLLPFVALLGYEMVTHENPFTWLGSDREGWMRGSRVRCFGSYRHPSLMGSLGATFFPIFVGALFHQRTRKTAVLGVILCLAIVIASNSGGPLSAWAAGGAAWTIWMLRYRMHFIRRCLFAGLIVVALMMSTPIWYVIERISTITGGAGWHRAYLIEVAFRSIGDWWFMGMPAIETRHWMPSVLSSGAADITNQYISFGVTAGLVAIILFIVLLVRSFRALGQSLNIVRLQDGPNGPDERFLWGFGVALAVHMVTWLGVSYFDKFSMFWLFQLACISSATQDVEDSLDPDYPHAQEATFDDQPYPSAAEAESPLTRDRAE